MSLPIDPDKIRLAEGELFSYKCLGCGCHNGGGIINEEHTREQRESDPYCPLNQPCIECKQGPVIIELSGIQT